METRLSNKDKGRQGSMHVHRGLRAKQDAGRNKTRVGQAGTREGNQKQEVKLKQIGKN